MVVPGPGDKTQANCARLREVDSTAVSDALDSLGFAGVALGVRCLTGRRRLSGAVVTVKLGPATGRTPDRHLCTAAVESAGPGQVIVVDNFGRTDVAGWGGLLSLAAAARGVEGVILDGACRDVDEATDLGFPVFARTAVPITARGRVVEEEWNGPVNVCGVSVRPGDYAIADSSGVVFIPAEHAERVIAVAAEIKVSEGAMVDQIKLGQPVGRVMGARYESHLEGG
jgi:regulator of RNase E activity RraA